MSRNGRGRGHLRANEMSSSPGTLTAFKIPVAGRSTALAGGQNVRVHPETHGAPGLTPLKSCFEEDAVEPLALGLYLDCLRARYDHGAYVRVNMMSSDNFGCGAQILDAGVRAGANKDAVNVDIGDWNSRLERH